MPESYGTKDKMRNAGTTNVVIVAPYHGIGLISGFNLAADYSYPVYGSICYSTATTTCSIVDPRKEFKGGEYFFFAPDGIHPNAAGAHALAKLIFEKL